MKKIIALILAALLVFAFAGCAKVNPAKDLENIQKEGKIVVGITEYKPMDYKDDKGEWTGFDAEFTRLVAKELGVEVEFVEIDWDNKFFELESGSIDCIWNGMTLTDDVKNNTSYSTPYVRNAQVVVLAKDKVDTYATKESIKDLKFAVEKGSAGEETLKNNTDVPDSNITAVDTQATALMEVQSGSVDACVIDITMANAMTGEGTGYASLGYKLELSSEEYVIGFRKDSNLTNKVNEIIKLLKEDGTLDALAKKYNLTLAF